MIESYDDAAADATESATCAALLETARRRQQATREKSPAAPRFLLEGARSLAHHMALPTDDVHERAAAMALWQLYLPAAFGAASWDFATVHERFPHSCEKVRAAVATLESRPQVVVTVFHMAAMPVICSMLGAAWQQVHDGRLHMVMAARNMAWARTGPSGWINDAGGIIDTGPSGLRELLAGLKAQSIRRLLVLPDGPQQPGASGTRALDGISPSLGIRTTLLAKIHSLGIPILPLCHEWENDRLVVSPLPVLDPSVLDATETIAGVVGHLEDVLRRHPEQWLNWNAARLRT